MACPAFEALGEGFELGEPHREVAFPQYGQSLAADLGRFVDRSPGQVGFGDVFEDDDGLLAVGLVQVGENCGGQLLRL